MVCFPSRWCCAWWLWPFSPNCTIVKHQHKNKKHRPHSKYNVIKQWRPNFASFMRILLFCGVCVCVSQSVPKTQSQQVLIESNLGFLSFIVDAGAHGIHNLPCAMKLRLWMGYRSWSLRRTCFQEDFLLLFVGFKPLLLPFLYVVGAEQRVCDYVSPHEPASSDATDGCYLLRNHWSLSFQLSFCCV